MLPKELPESSNLTLILRNNQITKFDYRPYLQNTSILELSGNLITDFTQKASSALKPSMKLDLTNNPLTKLLQEFQVLDPCSASFGEVKLKCDCSSVWPMQWSEKSRIKKCEIHQDIFAKQKTGKCQLRILMKAKYVIGECHTNQYILL